MESLDRWHRDERGVTFVELALTMLVLAVVATGVVGVLNTVNRAALANERPGSPTERARSALVRLENEVRSGAIVVDPALPNAECLSVDSPNNCLRVYEVAANGTGRCIEWRLNGATLQRRSWAPQTAPGAVWEDVAGGILNRSDTGLPPFRLDPLTGGRSIDLTFLVASDSGGTSTSVSLTAAVTGRNAGAPPAGACAP